MPNDLHDQNVAANVRAEMARAALTQTSLADSIGMTQQALSRRLSGQTPITVAELSRIAEALGVPTTKLFSEGDVA